MTEQFDNRQIIIDYLKSGSKGGDMGLVGIELEQFVLDEDGERVPYDEKHGRMGVRDILEALSAYYPDVTRTEDGDIMGCARAQAAITIEPSAQIEISIAPKLHLAEIEEEYNNFDFRIRQLLKGHEYKLAPFGYDPVNKALDLPLIPKPRYRYMDEYFSQIAGMYAERMMRATASLQVSIDFADEADAVRKMRIATLMGPIFSYLLDNIAVFEGAPNATPLRRLKVWREVDPKRCGVVPGLFEENFGFGSYADWLLSVPPIFSTRPDEHPTGSLPASQVYADAPMSTANVEHLLGMVWPDVRLKHYVEIRQCDAVPFDVALGYAALIKGIFYGKENLDLLEHALGVGDDGIWHYTALDVENAIDDIIADEMDARVYGRSVGAWIDLMFQFAPDGLGVEADYLEALKDFRGL